MVVILTKYYGIVSDEHPDVDLGAITPLFSEFANEGGLSRKSLLDAVDGSLERLRMYCIDFYCCEFIALIRILQWQKS